MKLARVSNELFYSYINIKNNPTKIPNKNRGINYGGKEAIRLYRDKKRRGKYI